MENLSMCRICLATDVRLCSIASHLRDMFERISSMTFKREDKRPHVVCYICHARLQNCYRLRTSCLQSEALLTEMMSSGEIKPQQLLLSTNTFRVVSVLHCSMGHMLRDNIKSHIKEEVSEIIHEAELDQQYTKDIVTEAQAEQCGLIDDNNQCSHLEEPLDIKKEVDDVETDAEYINLKDEIKTIEENCWEPDIAGSSLQPAENICPKIVKVVLERIDLYDNMIGARVSKRNKIAAQKDTEDATTIKRKIEVIRNEKVVTVNIKKPKIVTKEKKVKKSVTPSKKILETSNKVGINVNKCDDNVIISKVNDVCEEMSTNDTSFEKKCRLEDHNVSSASSSKSKQFSCNICMKWFTDKSTLEQHNRIHTGEKPYQCNVCNKCFKFKHHLITHIRTHTGEKPYQCNVCKNFFTQKASLYTHILIHTGEKPNQCNICTKRFIKKNDLKKHIRVHTGEKPYRCNICNYCFGRTSHLEDHIRIHTGEKPYECNVCKKRFKQKGELKTHNLVHTGEKPHQCNVCNKYLKRKDVLKSHIRTHTGEKPYQCNVCNKCFSDCSYYSKHIRKHKG